ncbi:MAG: hypothetical protein GY842_05480, partial [bacterium]|nr:hypothetical protein [bacterium]
MWVVALVFVGVARHALTTIRMKGDTMLHTSLIVLLLAGQLGAITPNEIAEHGAPIETSGFVQPVIHDDFGSGIPVTHLYLTTTDGAYYRLHLPTTTHLDPGSRVDVQGVLWQSEILVSKHSVAHPPKTRVDDRSLGEQRTAVILVNAVDNPIECITPQEAWEEVFDPGNFFSVANYV